MKQLSAVALSTLMALAPTAHAHHGAPPSNTDVNVPVTVYDHGDSHAWVFPVLLLGIGAAVCYFKCGGDHDEQKTEAREQDSEALSVTPSSIRKVQTPSTYVIEAR